MIFYSTFLFIFPWNDIHDCCKNFEVNLIEGSYESNRDYKPGKKIW